MSSKRRRHQRIRGIDYYADSDEEKNSRKRGPPQDTNRHVEYSAQAHGLSARTSFITTDATGSKIPPPPSTSTTGDSIPESDETCLDELTLQEPDHTEANVDYIHELSEMDETQKLRRRTAGDHPLREWVPRRDDWLAELLRHEGRCGFTAENCPRCGDGKAEIRCLDCNDLALYCQNCTIIMHKNSPFHRIKTWAQTHFRRRTLKELGLRIQVGHPAGDRCPNPQRAWGDDFIVLDISGIHQIGLDFCNCQSVQPHDIQLLRARLFPATTKDPKTAATFRLLEQFHLLSTQANVSGYQFYATLERRTDNTGLNTPKDRYPELMRLIRQWRHLKMLKRFGRGHSPGGVATTPPGSCAVQCPACPHPGMNLPENWQNAPPEQSWLYRLFLGIDANFRLKRKKVSTDEADPGLNVGFAYFVEEASYKEHIKTFSDVMKEEGSPGCSNHDAVKLANMRGSQGTAASGVGTVECTRHDMKRPCSVGDLQKGERYVNMDYLFASSMEQANQVAVVVSYDIACQWSIHLWERMRRYKPRWDFERHVITFLVPKFHLPAHREFCHLNYSFNTTLRVGRTDGEAVERGWSAVNPFASSTKEMGPGSRRDLLDDVFGAYNWGKVIQIGLSLLTKVKNAIDERSTHVAAFKEFTAALPASSIAQWTQAVDAWEKDRSSPNPYEVKRKAVTQASVRLQLAQEDAVRLQARETVPVHDQISSSVMITYGLEIEELQRHLREDSAELGMHSTDLHRAKVLERQNNLQRRLEAWTEIQHLYMPGVAALRSRPSDNASNAVSVLTSPLLLPSEVLGQVSCDSLLIDCELRLRKAQAHDALEALRRHLRLRGHLYSFKDRFVRGQRPNTRARGIIDNVQRKILVDVTRYRVAHRALEHLSATTGDLTWQSELRPLQSEDVRGMTEGLLMESEGRRTMSWIWRTTAIGSTETGNDDQGIQEALRVEWCKARARANRWSEECQLIEEEMRRVLEFHAYQARWWLDQIGQKTSASEEHQEGLVAYALCQSELRTSLGAFCKHTWRPVNEWLKLGVCTIDNAVKE